MMDNYILIGQSAVPCNDLNEWAEWFEHSDRCVALTQVMDICYVSTVFLGFDHSFARRFINAQMERFDGMPVADCPLPPVLFESMIFWDGEHGEEQARCSTWAEAEAMHADMVAEASSPRAVLGYALRMLHEFLYHAKRDWQDCWQELRIGAQT